MQVTDILQNTENRMRIPRKELRIGNGHPDRQRHDETTRRTYGKIAVKRAVVSLKKSRTETPVEELVGLGQLKMSGLVFVAVSALAPVIGVETNCG